MLRSLHRFLMIFGVSLGLMVFSGASVQAQDYCAGIFWETELSSGDQIESTIGPDDVLWYYFEANAGDVWRFDVVAALPVQFDFFDPENRQNFAPSYEDALLWVIPEAQEAEHTAFNVNQDGIYCLRASQYENAIISFGFILTLLPEQDGELLGTNDLNGFGNNAVGNWYWEQGDYENALDFYLLSLEELPDDAVVWGNACGAYFWLGEYEDAIDACSESLSIERNYLMALDFRAASYRSVGDYESAMDDYDRYLSNNSTADWMFLARAQNAILLGEPETAIDDATTYYALRGERSTCTFWRGIAHMANENYGQGLSDFELDTNRCDVNHAMGYLWQAISQIALDADEDTIEALLEAAEDAADGDELLEARVATFISLLEGDEDDAQEAFEEVLDISPLSYDQTNNLIYLTLLAEMFPDEDIFADTLEWFREELDLD